MSAKIVSIQNPIPSDDGQIGGEYTNQLTKLLKGVVISNAEEVFTIATPINFLSGSILLADENNTHKYSIEAENIGTGGTRHVRFPTMNIDETQQVVMTLEQQTITKKTIGTGSKFIVDLDIDGNNILKLKEINIRDLGNRDISLLDYNGANPNTYFDILSGYNTTAFSGISAATDIELRFGYNSEIDSIEFWSKASGFNEQLIKIFAGTNSTTSKIDFNVDIIDFHNPTINNIMLSKTQIPSTVVHTNQANLFDNYVQDFPSEWIRIKSGSNFVALGSLSQTGNFSFLFPTLTSNDIALTEANIAPISNKTLDVRTNTVLRMARIGRYHCASESGVDAEGVLQGLVGLGDQGTTTLNTAGKYHPWSTKAVIDDCAGVVKLNGFVTQRYVNPLARFAFLFVVSSTRRAFKGWTAKRLLSVESNTEPLLSTESGFVFGYGAGDANWQIWHNDGTGTCVKVDTGLAIPTISTNLILEISNSGATFTWALYGVNGATQARSTLLRTGTISTRVPGSFTNLFLQDLVSTSAASIQANNIHYIEVFT